MCIVVYDPWPSILLDIVDIKPANMEDLTEVITAAEFHPQHCHLFVYSSSKGTLRLCDMRSSALCDKHTKCKSPTFLKKTKKTKTGSCVLNCVETVWSLDFASHKYQTVQCLKNRKIQGAAPSFPKSSPLCRMSSSATMDATCWPETTSPPRCGIWTWTKAPWRHIR